MRKNISILPVLGLLAFGLIGAAQAASVAPGSLIKASGAAVYYYGTDGKRYVFPTEKIFKTWYADFSTVQKITDAELAAIAIGGNVTYRPGVRMVKVTTDPKVYAVAAGGTLRPIEDEATAKALYGDAWNTRIDDLPDAFFANYKLGLEITKPEDYSVSDSRGAATSIAKDKELPDAAEAPEVPEAESSEEVSTLDPHALPVGDGKYSSKVKAGFIYACQTSFNGQGAQGATPWITGSTWDPSKKPAVQGSVSWPNASVSITVSGSNRVIASNALPTDHVTGIYPISSSDPAHQYDANPNSIKAQSISITVPASPTVAASPTCVGGEVGISVDGVPIFDGFDAEGRDAAAHEIQDRCDGHPQEAGEYHYHSGSACVQTGSSGLFGYAYDGFGIYYEKDASGNELTNADLDACHGRVSQVLWDGKLTNIYHYVVTQEFPYTVGCFMGTPTVHGPTASGGGQQGGMMPPPPRF